MNTFLGTKVFINQCITLKFIFTTTFRKMFQVSIMISIKEERSRGTVGWPPNLQTTNLVLRFWLSVGRYPSIVPINTIFILKFSKPFLLNNIKGKYHKLPIYSSSTLFFLDFDRSKVDQWSYPKKDLALEVPTWATKTLLVKRSERGLSSKKY